VAVRASGTSPVDAKLRVSGTWAGLEPPVVLGYDAAGVVEAVGPGVGDFKPGDGVTVAGVRVLSQASDRGGRITGGGDGVTPGFLVRLQLQHAALLHIQQ